MQFQLLSFFSALKYSLDHSSWSDLNAAKKEEYHHDNFVIVTYIHVCMFFFTVTNISLGQQLFCSIKTCVALTMVKTYLCLVLNYTDVCFKW